MTAEHFDQWYAELATSDAEQRLFTEGLGVPYDVNPSNLVPLEGLQDIARRLAIPSGGLLVDLACGRGGPGMWLSRELGAELIGIDFSAEAIAQASARRALFGMETNATFAVGTFDATGLPAGAADGVVCIDAFQFAPAPVAAAGEIRRVLRAGGRVVLTNWEPIEPGDERVPERLRHVDLVGTLAAAGFQHVERIEQPRWREIEHEVWQRALSIDPAGDPGLESAREEAERVLATFDRFTRVLATATAP